MKTFLSTCIFIFLCSLGSFSANYYWVGGTGNWSDYANHWATTSGGTSFHTIEPGQTDNVFFDASSFSAAGQILTIDVEATCNNMDWTGSTNDPTLTGTATLNIYGSLTLISGMTFSYSGITNFLALSTGQEITMAGQSFNNHVYFDGIGSWTLQDELNIPSKILYLQTGTLTTNDQDIVAYRFSSNTTNTRTLNLGSSVFSITYGFSEAFYFRGDNMTINPGTSLLKFTGSGGGMNFSTTGGLDFYNVLYESTGGTSYYRNGGGTFHNITFNSASGRLNYGSTGNKVIFNQAGMIYQGTCNIDTVEFKGDANIETGGHTFGRVWMDENGNIDENNTFTLLLELTEGFTYDFDAGRTQTINGDLVAIGTCSNPINIQSSSATQAIFSKTSGAITVTRVNLANMSATGGATFTANESIDLGNNTGWIINPPSAQNLYWVNDGGDWDDPGHWASSSGGTGGACVPTILDNVYFDANSFTSAGQTVNLIGDIINNNAYCKDMDWTGVTNNPTLAGASTINLKIYGSLTFDAGMTVTYTGITYFNSTAAGNTVTSAGHAFGNNVIFYGSGGVWTLQDALNIPDDILYLVDGTLTTNDHDITTYRFSSNYSNTRVLNLGSSTFSITAGISDAFNFNGTNMIVNPESSLLKFTASGGGMNYAVTGGLDFYDVLFESTGGTSYYRNIGGTFHNILFNSASGRLNSGSTGNKVIFNQASVIYGGTCNIDTVEFKGDANIDTGGHTFGWVWMDDNGNIDGSNTFNDLLELTEGFTYIFDAAATQTFNGDLVAVGTCFFPINIQSSSSTQANFSKASGSITLTRVNLTDMNATGGAIFTANASFDLGNNTGWTINAPTSQDLYWVGGTGDWDDPDHWSYSSGGTNGACLPTVQDNVFFDANSFTDAGQTVTLIGDGNDNANCLNMDWTGVLNNPTLAGASTINLRVYGSLAFDAGMTVTYTGITYFNSTAAGNTVTSAGHAFGNNVIFYGSGGVWTLQDALNIPDDILYLVDGTLTTNDHDVTTYRFSSNYTNTRVLNLGSSTFSITAGISDAFNFNGTNMIVNPESSLLKFTASGGGMNFASTGGLDFYDVLYESTGGTSYYRNGGGTFHNIIFNSVSGRLNSGSTGNKVIFNQAGVIYGGTCNIDTVEFKGDANIDTGGHTFGWVWMDDNGNIDGSNTFNDLLELTEGFTYIFDAAATQTFNGDLVAVGTCFFPINIQSSSSTQANFSKASGSITLTRVNLTDMNATGGAIFTANASFDLGNNTGWTINAPTSQDLYWVGGTGNWDDPDHWSYSSGGTNGACLPTVQDNVFFDANSFTDAGQTVTLIGDGNDNANCLSMDWTGVLNNPTLAGASTINLRIYGSLTFDAGMTVTYTGETYFHSTTAGNTVTSAGHAFGNNVRIDGTGGEWTLQDALNIPGDYLFFVDGTLTSNDHDITASRFYSIYTNTRVLNLGSSVFTITSTSADAFEFRGDNMTVNPGTSLLKFTASGGSMNYSSTGEVDLYDVLFEYLGGTSYYRNIGGTFHNIIFNSATGRINYGSTGNKVVFNQAGVIYNGISNIDTVEFKGYANIETGGHIFGRVWMDDNGKIDGSNTFDYLEFSPGKTYTLQYNQTQTIVDDFTADGSCSQAITLQSSTVGSQTTISKAGGIITIQRVNLQDMNATGGATFNARGCTDNGNNTGWIFTAIGPEDLYWVGGTGDWDEISHWAGSSGGAGGYCLPTAIDNVYFDANSFTDINQGVFVNLANVEINNMDWTGVTNNPAFSSYSNLYILKLNGSLTISPNMNFSFDGNVYFQSTTTGNTVDMSGFLFNDDVAFTGAGGEWTLLSNTGSTGDNSLTVSDGLLDLGSYLYESSGTTIIDGGTLKLSDNSLLEVGANDSIVVRSGATLEVLGSAGNEATIKGYNDQNYVFRVRSGATIRAQYANFLGMSDKGLYIMDGASVDPAYPFNYCTFSEGIIGGAATILTIDNNQTLTIDHAVFPHNTWSGNYNVAKTINQGHLSFTNASGNYAGPVFEDDSYDLIDWPGLRAGKWTGYADEMWHNAANWEFYFYPDTAEQVTIPEGRPNDPKVMNYTETCNGLDVQSGAILWVNNNPLTINGDAMFDGNLKMDHSNGVMNITGDLKFQAGSDDDGISNGTINLDGNLYLDNGTDVNMGNGNTMNLNGIGDCYIYSNDATAILGSVVCNKVVYYDNSGTQALHLSGDLTINEDFFMQKEELIVDGDLKILNTVARGVGKLMVYPSAAVTAGGNVQIDSPEGIEIQSSSTNTGSFIGNSDYTYGTGGSVKISTYLYNNPASGHNWHYHQVGAMLNDPGTAYQGVPLSFFNVENDQTYAYRFRNSDNTWLNIISLDEEVRASEGIMLTTDNNTSYTLSMTGDFNSGDAGGVLQTPAVVPAGLNLLANPYSSAIDFDAFYTTNNAAMGANDFYYVWQDGIAGPDYGNYAVYDVSSGGAAGQYVPVGGGMFLDLGGTPSQLQFLSPPAAGSHTVHQNLPLFKDKKAYLDRLVLDIEGNSFHDQAIVHFMEGSSNGFSLGEDVYKWKSMLENATEAWMIVDGQDVTINSPEPLLNNPYQVPLHFKCGKQDSYSITASGLESFESGALIWIEDLLTGKPWHNLNADPVYTFTGGPEDNPDRFILHFMGTQGIDEPAAIYPVTVYSTGKYVYIVNKGNERVREYIVFDMLGRELMRGDLPSADVNRICIDSGWGVYIICALTGQNVYTQKVVISE